jgi:hypothetical protein
MAQWVAREIGQKRPGDLGEGGVVRTCVGMSQRAQRGGEPAAGVRIAPGIGLLEQRRYGFA